MASKNYLSYALIIFSCFSFTSCRLPFSSCGKHASKDAFQIIDLRTGGGEKGIETPKTEFSFKEKIWLNFDVKNIVAMKEDGTSYFWIRQDLTIRDPKGRVILTQPGVLNIRRPVSEKPGKFINEISLANFKNLIPGKYTVTLLVTDIIAFKTDSKTMEIKLK